MFENFAPASNPALAAESRLECGICWWVYDPQAGDAAAGVPPGTPFAALPEHWRCPECDGSRDGFLVLGDGR
jgi:rubredoxin